MAGSGARTFRKRCHEALDGGSPQDGASRIVHRGIVALILVSVMAVILESVPSFAVRFGLLFQGIHPLNVRALIGSLSNTLEDQSRLFILAIVT
jgi:hypothetical protein